MGQGSAAYAGIEPEKMSAGVTVTLIGALFTFGGLILLVLVLFPAAPQALQDLAAEDSSLRAFVLSGSFAAFIIGALVLYIGYARILDGFKDRLFEVIDRERPRRRRR